jgi:hypothetical protein
LPSLPSALAPDAIEKKALNFAFSDPDWIGRSKRTGLGEFGPALEPQPLTLGSFLFISYYSYMLVESDTSSYTENRSFAKAMVLF